MLNLRRIGGPLVAGLLLAALSATLAMAQSPLGIGSAEPSIPTTGVFGGFFAWVNMEQQSFYRLLTGALKDMRDNPWQLWSLIGLSFAYGVFHAAGPGHGKAVISSYMIANETELKRGVLLSFLSSILQGVVAILLIGAVYLVLRGSSINMTRATHWLEVASYALIAAFGSWLVFRKLRSMARPRLALADGHAHHQHGSHDHGHHGHHHSHHHGDAHGPGEVCATCGHAHAPDPQMLKGDRFALSEAWSAIVAVGLRPCSGALIVLSFALLNGLYLGGVLSVFAMSIGTAITVSILATLAVTAKGFAVRYASSQSAAARISNGIEIAGALLVLVLGLVLLGAALQG
ncbi:nickel ABC transporter permease [Sinorhizobium fredii USDA 205]|uniref:Nickel/cobalt efflux system n=4 Tax=Rhizobium fredii TaxID=380 RepID=A0A2A6LZI9_RHIFR|nr:nickel/cobalt transporter [Sinorhizobium fredii]AWM26591.1 putative membrane protein [Sinorhizobium fredii CCBAU 25509]KSV90579.1 nickel ABC transporter permease [Sinorhizobium fredii USDA 205]MCG5475268.1 nickel/cobalt transporter [Sinorhizobium fredii]MQW96885.1 delayed-early response protein/equilibrative nucleoside transporter [Sinorhizobium fredii]MQX09893.1 delayed-early response protein/equilibrative nucleoside transporter [Sinorhizobium fredii]